MSLLRRIDTEKESNGGEGQDGETDNHTPHAESYDELKNIRELVQQRLLDELGPFDGIPSDILRKQIDDLFQSILTEENILLDADKREHLRAQVVAVFPYYSPLEMLIQDDTITEIMTIGHQKVFIERKGRLELAPIHFESELHLRNSVEQILSAAGIQLDEVSSIVNARLPDGSWVEIMMPPVAVDGIILTIRKVNQPLLSVQNHIDSGSSTVEVMEFLRACVISGFNIIVSGETGSGKTTLLNILAGFIPADERIFVLERIPELQLRQEHVIRLHERPQDSEEQGAVSLKRIIDATLRSRPDVIVVDEVQGSEALALIKAMNTGHDGSMATVYGNSPHDAITRLEMMCSMSGMNFPPQTIREYIASAVHLICHIDRLRDGSRKITRITEVQGMESDVTTLADIFVFEQTGVDDTGKIVGRFRPTGLRPKLMNKIIDSGINMPPQIFGISKPEPQPVEKEKTETQPVEDVYFSLYYPQEAAAGEWYTLLVYAHLDAVCDAVKKDAAKFIDEMADEVRESKGKTPTGLKRGTELRLVPHAEEVEFKPASLTVTWDEDYERANFRFKAAHDLIDQPCFGEMSVFVGPVEVASIRFSVFVKDTAGIDAKRPANISTQAKLYNKIFTSYSYADTEIVKACIQAFKALGHEILVDFDKLRSGDDWDQRLLDLINEAEIFQLFWSESSAKSKAVEREWRHALQRDSDETSAPGVGFIRPVYWEPDLPDIPDELSHIHFKHLPHLAQLSTESTLDNKKLN